MSIRYGLLALLKGGPKYGYQLRGEFEEATGGTWPLNVGQVYTTLGRLERDGLVQGVGTDESGRVRYELTADGDAELGGWFRTPISRESPPRDELAIKLALALVVPGADIQHIVQAQRTATIRTLQEYTRLKGEARATDQTDQTDPADLPWSLVLDSLIFAAEAEIRWLDHCEARLSRSAAARSSRSTTQQTAEPTPTTTQQKAQPAAPDRKGARR